MNSIDYSTKLKEELNRLTKRPKDSSNLYLSTRIQNKIKQMDIKINKSVKEEYIIFILKNSLYLIKENGFITEKYFSWIDNRIYKLFYEFLISPDNKQLENFIKGF